MARKPGKADSPKVAEIAESTEEAGTEAVNANTSTDVDVSNANTRADDEAVPETAENQNGDSVIVQVTRCFTDSATGVFRTPSDEAFSTTRRRAAELSANGLVREVSPQPDNKMAQPPSVKE